jgi:hypothetical protein
VIITDLSGRPCRALNAHRFLRDTLFQRRSKDLRSYLHQPILTTDTRTPLGKLIGQLRMRPKHEGNEVIEETVILLWASKRRIVTGDDILGRLLRGIAQQA